MNALGVLWFADSVTRRMRPVLGCACSCVGFSVIFWPWRCRCRGLSMGFKAVSFHFCGVVTFSLGCVPCAIRHTSSQASRCLFCGCCASASGPGFCRASECGSAHARHTLIGWVFMAFMSCVRTLWGRVGFCSVGSCRLLLSLFDRILGAFFSVVGVGFLSRVFL